MKKQLLMFSKIIQLHQQGDCMTAQSTFPHCTRTICLGRCITNKHYGYRTGNTSCVGFEDVCFYKWAFRIAFHHFHRRYSPRRKHKVRLLVLTFFTCVFGFLVVLNSIFVNHRDVRIFISSYYFPICRWRRNFRGFKWGGEFISLTNAKYFLLE